MIFTFRDFCFFVIFHVFRHFFAEAEDRVFFFKKKKYFARFVFVIFFGGVFFL